MRVFECDACGLVLDRDENAGHNLVALAARMTGTGVAGDLDNAVEAESKPRGADRKTRTTRPRRKAGTGRAGGTIPSPRAGKETGDRQQDTGAQLALR
nr:transposase [Streptomyces sp. NBC_00830]